MFYNGICNFKHEESVLELNAQVIPCRELALFFTKMNPAELESHLVYESRMFVSGDNKMNEGLPDLCVVASLGSDHELDRLERDGHVSLCVQWAIWADAKLGVTALEADPVVQMTSLEADYTK